MLDITTTENKTGTTLSPRGDWLQTCTGRVFYPIDPRPEEIFIADIAGALSKQCRFGGHCDAFYSVAEHCVHMARFASPALKLTALLHDASEAYLVDIPRPVKSSLTNYAELEDRLMRAIAVRFGIQWPLPPEIKALDNAILAAERDQLMKIPPQDWGLHEPPLDVALGCWEPRLAERHFLKLFEELTTTGECW